MAEKLFLVVSPGTDKEVLEKKFTGSCAEIVDKETSGVSVWVIKDSRDADSIYKALDMGVDDIGGIVVEIDSETDIMGWVISSAWATVKKWMRQG